MSATDAAIRLYSNLQDDQRKISKLQREIAEIMANACMSALHQVGFNPNQRQQEQLMDLMEEWQ